MSVPTLRRIFLAAALLLSAQALLAASPSARSGARMVFDESTGVTVLFGGQTASDAGTVQTYDPQETWLWSGTRWVLRYPEHSPAGRSSHVMVYDAARKRVVLFGGHAGSTDLDDTWVWSNNDWTQITTASAPSPRSFSGAAYDRARDRVVLFGGLHTTLDAKNNVTRTNYYDTWEFDGANWTRVADNGPQVLQPLLAYDESHNQLIMVAENDKFDPQMYVYDPGAHAWNQITPATMPPCVNQSALTYQRSSGTLFLVGGVCITDKVKSPSTEEAWVWNGTDWAKLTTKSAIIRTTNPALTYDPVRNLTVEFGGTEAFGLPTSAAWAFDASLADDKVNGDWIVVPSNGLTPGPRSLAPMRSDPVNKVIYMLNGLTDGTYHTDFWKYENGGWQQITAEHTPACGTPFAAFDKDRGKLVAVCSDGGTFEFDGSAWKTFDDLKTKPPYRVYASMVYDENLKKTVLYGGYDGQNYVDNTWTWDGTTWSEVRRGDRAPARGLAAAWYDPILKKTVVYGGIGRPRPSDRLQRYNDMWAFDGTTWKEIKPAALPTTRYGAQVAVNPSNGHAILFGGLRLDIDDKGLQKQVYANDMWEWDGTTWKQLQTNNVPPARENAAMAFDYGRNSFVLFGGWSGFYRSDTWLLEGDTWRPVLEPLGRSRAVRR